jgi:hypothetical protein
MRFWNKILTINFYKFWVIYLKTAKQAPPIKKVIGLFWKWGQLQISLFLENTEKSRNSSHSCQRVVKIYCWQSPPGLFAFGYLDWWLKLQNFSVESGRTAPIEMFIGAIPTTRRENILIYFFLQQRFKTKTQCDIVPVSRLMNNNICWCDWLIMDQMGYGQSQVTLGLYCTQQ